ncbi:MAG: hypothetical protein ACOX2O_00470 [Bdellovibrionota bacterium]|jgi:hypothetical protein
MRKKNLNRVKEQVLTALHYPEAEDGLFFRNFFYVHEEDDRPVVEADQIDILKALNELVKEGVVKIDDSEEEMIFSLA